MRICKRRWGLKQHTKGAGRLALVFYRSRCYSALRAGTSAGAGLESRLSRTTHALLFLVHTRQAGVEPFSGPHSASRCGALFWSTLGKPVWSVFLVHTQQAGVERPTT